MREVEHLEKGGSLEARSTLNPSKDLALASGSPLPLVENRHDSHRAWEQAHEEEEQTKTHARTVSSNNKKAFMEASHRVAEIRAAAKYAVAKDPQCNTLPKSLKACKGSRRRTQLQWRQAKVVSALNPLACSHHSLEPYGLAPKALRRVEQTVHKAETLYRSHLLVDEVGL